LWVYHPLFHSGSPSVTLFRFTHPQSIVWVHILSIWLLCYIPSACSGLTPRYSSRDYQPLFIRVMRLLSLFLGLYTYYLVSGFTHPLSFIWVYAPVILFVLGLHPQFAVWDLHTFSPCTCIFIWVYAAIVFYLSLRTCIYILSWVYTPDIFHLGLCPLNLLLV
jgi:hypothetical protein